MQQRQGGLKGRACAWGVAFVAMLASLGALAAPAGAVPAKFWGVAPQDMPTVEQFQRLKQGGVDSLRFLLDWGTVQPVQGGAIDWSYVDTYVGRSAAAGIEPLPVISGAPEWAVRKVLVNAASHSTAPATLPVKTATQRESWQNLLSQAALRYGPNGTFWAENPGLPVVPIRAWQIWNEENFKYFVAAPNPADYGKLVKLSYIAIRGVDPSAQLILGGMFSYPKEGEDKYKKLKPRPAYFATEFLDKMYETTPGIKSKFQGVALHPYTYNFKRLTPYIEEFRTVMKEHGDAGKGLWITELGWSSGLPSPANGRNRFEKGPQGQVKQLQGAFKLLEANQVRWKVKRVFWFSVDDAAANCNFCDGSGLFGPGFVPKPSWPAYVKFAGGVAG